MSCGNILRKYARSSASAGVNSTCAAPPTRNQVSGAISWLAASRPRRSGIAAFRSGVMSGKSTALAQRLQLARQRVGPLGDVAGAEADDVVALLGKAAHHAG